MRSATHFPSQSLPVFFSRLKTVGSHVPTHSAFNVHVVPAQRRFRHFGKFNRSTYLFTDEVCFVEVDGSVLRSSDVDGMPPSSVDDTRLAAAAPRSSTFVQQVVGCVFGAALALSLLVVATLVLCRRRRRVGRRRRAAVSKATAAAAVAGVRPTSTFRLFGGRRATSLTRDDSATLTSTGKTTTSNGVSSFSNCSMIAAGTAANDDDDYDDYDVTATLARCFRLPHDVIQSRQLPKPPHSSPHTSSPYRPPSYVTGASFLYFSSLSCFTLDTLQFAVYLKLRAFFLKVFLPF